jgi:hypothetical protein
MAKKTAHTDIVKVIRKLVADPNKVRLTDKARFGLYGISLNKVGLCELICSWIDGGGEVEEKVTEEPAEFKGEIVYVMKPSFEGARYYLRMTIAKRGGPGEGILVISVHQAL